MRQLVLGMVGALALAGAAQAKDARESSPTTMRSEALDSDLAQQLKPALKEFEDAWNRHDPKAMAAAFSEDAVLINPSGRLARGHAEIEKLFEDEQRGVMKSTEFSHRLTDVRQIAPGVVFVDEEITITGARDPSGRALPDQHVHGVFLAAKQGGRWQVTEGRPYVFAPSGQRSVASGAGPSGDSASGPQQSGTGSGSAPEEADGTTTGSGR